MSSKVSLVAQFDRVLAQPIETNTVFTSYDNLLEYVKTGSTAYAGQILRVVNNQTTDVYVIKQDRTVEKLGGYYAVFDAVTSPQTIIHNLGRCPNVLFVGEDGEVYEVNVTYPNLNQVQVIWNNNDVKGKIYLL